MPAQSVRRFPARRNRRQFERRADAAVLRGGAARGFVIADAIFLRSRRGLLRGARFEIANQVPFRHPCKVFEQEVPMRMSRALGRGLCCQPARV